MSSLPFITREIRRLKVIKNIEMKKSNSMNNLNIVKLKNSKESKFNLQKIYKYYFSKPRIREMLMNQKISTMRKNLHNRQLEEKNTFFNNFYISYPPESNYNKEIKEFDEEINKYKKENNINEMKKSQKLKEEFLVKKHDEYLEKLGDDYEKELEKLKVKFKEEREEQNILIREIILNHKIREMELEKINSKYNKENRGYKRNKFNLSQDEFYKYNNNNNANYINNNNNNNNNILNSNKLASKEFRFGGENKPYKTVLI